LRPPVGQNRAESTALDTPAGMILGPDSNVAPRTAPVAVPGDHWQRLRVAAVQPRLWLELAIDY